MAQLFIKYALTGGGNDALDGVDGAILNGGDFAFTFEGGYFYLHLLKNDSGEAESSPQVIAPVTNAGDKRWELLTVAQEHEIKEKITAEGLTVENDAKIKGKLEVLLDLIVGGQMNVDAAATIAGFLQVNNDADFTGNVDASGFTIDGTPIGTSTDTYWNSDGNGNIYYRSGNVLGNPIALNKYEITQNWKIPSGYHGCSVGPLDIDGDITIAENSVWEVL